MNYVLLVSHGSFAQGLHQALTMFVGDRDDIKSIGLEKGEDVASLASRINELLANFHEADRFIVLGDLIGGSPLTTMLRCLEQNNFLRHAVVLGGMNLAMALNAVLMKDDLENAKTIALQEGMQAMQELQLTNEEDDEI